MSVEQAKALIEKMKADEAFSEKVMSIEDVAGRLAFIRNEGFTCTADEINEVTTGEAEVIGGATLDCRIFGCNRCLCHG